MIRLARLSVAAGALGFLFACTGDTVAPPSVSGPSFAVSDGAHEGNPDFFFLPPLFKNPNSSPQFEPGAFNGSLRPAVEICELGAAAASGARECIAGPLIKRFAPGAVNVSITDQQYHVNWNTSESALNVAKFYRISVLVGSTVLGFADIDPVSNGSQLKNVQTGEYIGLVDGRTLPIKFRIESGALCVVDGVPCASKTITLSQGGGVTLSIDRNGVHETFHFDIASGTTATSGERTVTDVTFSLEECSGIDVDLPKFGLCMRLTSVYDATGSSSTLSLSKAALVSMCSFSVADEDQEELITLHQQDGDLIRALPHALPNCGGPILSPGLGSRAWQWMRDIAAKLLTPRPAFASSRSAMLHLGGGGETSRLGAVCTPPPASAAFRGVPRLALGTCVPTVAMATPFPSNGHIVTDFQFALPAQMDYVDPDDASRSAAPGTSLPTAVKVTDWNGAAVQGARVTFTETDFEGPGTVIGTALSNADGIAQVSWTVAAGTNTLIASGRGIAAQNNYDGTVRPFMPDIFSGAPQTPVVVRIGEVTFVATGTLVGSLQFIQQPTNTVTGQAISPALVIQVRDPSGQLITGSVGVTVGNAPDNPAECQVLQRSGLALDGIATFSNVLVNGTCTGARVAATAGGGAGGAFTFPTIVSAPFDIVPAVTGLLLRYQFDGNVDNTGLLSGYNGTATSVSYPDGKFGQAIKFDGTTATGATLAGTAGAFATGSKWTISLWFREDAPPKTESLLWRFRGETQGFESYHGVTAALLTTCSDGGCFSFSPGVGVWHNVIYRYNAPSEEVGAPIDIYVDGALAGQITNGTSIPLVGSGVTDIRIGNAGDILGPSLFYMDEFRVYNQVFTVAAQCTGIIGGTWTGESCTMP
jgi:hypothetical protein